MKQINSQHLKVQKVINKLQKQGTYTDIFQTMMDMDLQPKIISDAYRFVADALKIENYRTNVKNEWDRLPYDKKYEIFYKLLNYLKKYYVNFKKETIKIISKKELLKVLECNTALLKVYNQKSFNVCLLRNMQNVHTIQNNNINNILDVLDIYLNIKITKTDTVISLTGFTPFKENKLVSKTQNPYDFIVESIEKINKENAYFKFIWKKDKDE